MVRCFAIIATADACTGTAGAGLTPEEEGEVEGEDTLEAGDTAEGAAAAAGAGDVLRDDRLLALVTLLTLSLLLRLLRTFEAGCFAFTTEEEAPPREGRD